MRASPRLPTDQSLRRAPARSGTLCLSEFAPLAATARASRQSSVSSTVRRFPNQGQQTVVRRPHPKDPREAPPCPMLSHDRVGVASGFCSICSFILFAHTIPSEISLARSILATRHWRFSALLPKTGRRRHDEQTLCRRTSRAPTKQASPLAHQLSLGHLLPSEGARAACRSCHVARPPPARFRGRGPDARIVCFFSARLLVGWISHARAGVARRASSTIVFAAQSRGWFLSPPRSVGSLAARVASRAATAAGAPRGGPIIPRERRLFRSRLVVPVPDRRSGFCPALVAAIENRRA